jgi:gamma-glutamylcysteine synthetase
LNEATFRDGFSVDAATHVDAQMTKMIPPEIQASRAAMEEFALAFAKDRRWRVWLVLSKRTRVWFNEKGERTGVTEDTFEESFGPYMRLAGKKFLLGLLDGAVVDRKATA